ncbi:MAG: class I SAM-dependent methyltransferase [Burkholderiales bacterium]|nr:class I SAM-dependent methyltransferase [Burkholderiales bacterium]
MSRRPRAFSRVRRRLLAALPLAALATRAALAQRNAGPYVPTPWPIVDAMLALAGVHADDFLIDLGCGDGRLVITAARRFGARGYGVDIDPELVKLAQANAVEAGVAARVRFEERDLFETDIRAATVLTLYLLPHIVTDLVPRILEQMPAGARVVSHDYALAPWPHDEEIAFDVPEKELVSGTTFTRLYRYVVPARIGGEWRLELPGAQPARLSVRQRGWRATAAVASERRTAEVDEIVIRGASVRILLPPVGPDGARTQLEGRLRGDTLEGDVVAPRGRGAWRAVRLQPPRGQPKPQERQRKRLAAGGEPQ